MKIGMLGLASLGGLAAMAGMVTPLSSAIASTNTAPGQGQGRRSFPSFTAPLKPRGDREKSRRVRQIAAGSLRPENGLVRS